VPVPPKVRASLATGKAKSMLAFFLYARRVADKPCLHSKEQGQEPDQKHGGNHPVTAWGGGRCPCRIVQERGNSFSPAHFALQPPPLWFGLLPHPQNPRRVRSCSFSHGRSCGVFLSFSYLFYLLFYYIVVKYLYVTHLLRRLPPYSPSSPIHRPGSRALHRPGLAHPCRLSAWRRSSRYILRHWSASRFIAFCFFRRSKPHHSPRPCSNLRAFAWFRHVWRWRLCCPHARPLFVAFHCRFSRLPICTFFLPGLRLACSCARVCARRSASFRLWCKTARYPFHRWRMAALHACFLL